MLKAVSALRRCDISEISQAVSNSGRQCCPGMTHDMAIIGNAQDSGADENKDKGGRTCGLQPRQIQRHSLVPQRATAHGACISTSASVADTHDIVYFVLCVLTGAVCVFSKGCGFWAPAPSCGMWPKSHACHKFHSSTLVARWYMLQQSRIMVRLVFMQREM